jgi:2-polyprenyl-3-methyl-5-hydroxy-6-metoxy-1,4-benzoquinol methylase
VQPLEPHKQAEIDEHEHDRLHRPEVWHKPFGAHWGSPYWGKWHTAVEAFIRLAIEPGSRVLDVGCGPGWTSLFLEEAGYPTVGIDLAPAHVEISRMRAERWGLSTRFAVEDMEAFDLGEQFDAALVFDALHHSRRQADVVANIARHLRPGAWVLFGEPSLLHNVSPEARQVSRERGWVERGVGVHRLKRDCRAAGLEEFRRFFEGTSPYESRVREFGWQVVRLVAANLVFAPQMSIWLAARKRA